MNRMRRANDERVIAAAGCAFSLPETGRAQHSTAQGGGKPHPERHREGEGELEREGCAARHRPRVPHSTARHAGRQSAVPETPLGACAHDEPSLGLRYQHAALDLQVSGGDAQREG